MPTVRAQASQQASAQTVSTIVDSGRTALTINEAATQLALAKLREFWARHGSHRIDRIGREASAAIARGEHPAQALAASSRVAATAAAAGARLVATRTIAMTSPERTSSTTTSRERTSSTTTRRTRD